jgi:peroxiredoxin
MRWVYRNFILEVAPDTKYGSAIAYKQRDLHAKKISRYLRNQFGRLTLLKFINRFFIAMKRFLLLLFVSGCAAHTPLKTGLEGTLLPDFKLKLTDSINYISTTTAEPGKSIVLVNLSAHCPYCRAQLKDICKQNKELAEFKFYLSSTDPLPDLKNLYEENELSKYPNIILGADTSAAFSKYFKTKKIPCTAIYNDSGKLKGVYEGTMKASEIKELARE